MMVRSRATRNMQRNTEIMTIILVAWLPFSGAGCLAATASGVSDASLACLDSGGSSVLRAALLWGLSGRFEAIVTQDVFLFLARNILHEAKRRTVLKSVMVVGPEGKGQLGSRGLRMLNY